LLRGTTDIDVCPTVKSDFLSLQYVIDNCVENIYVKSKDTVHECEIEFGLLPMSDVFNIRKKKNFSLCTASPTTFYGNSVDCV